MTQTGSMTAAVWLAPMVPKLPLPLAQRVERLLEAKPGAQTREHTLVLCEAIVAYAACMRACVAAAVLPDGHKAPLAAGAAEFRRTIGKREATIADFLALLLAAADAIEALEPGHPLGRTELERPRTAWVARTHVIEALGDELDDGRRQRILDGGMIGIFELWIALVEAHKHDDAGDDDVPWLPPLGDLIVDVLNSSALGEASLSYPEQAEDGGLGALRLLHGRESGEDPAPAEAEAYAPGVVCWRFDARVISACGLLSFWVDEHEFEHVGILVRGTEYLDFGTGARGRPVGDRAIDWAALEPVAPAVASERGPVPFAVIAAGIIMGLLLLVGVVFVLLPDDDDEQGTQANAAGLAVKTAKQDEPDEPEPVAELVIEGQQPEPEPAPTVRRSSAGDETGGSEQDPEAAAELPTAPLWFESERSLGTCQISYEGHTRTANLHVKTRAPEGKLEFSYRCGEYRGRGSIDVKRSRVNGVLFCKKDGAVRVKTVRSNEGRCDR